MRGFYSNVVDNAELLDAYLKRHPELRLAAVCTCGKIMPASSIGGHISASNRKWTIKAGFAGRHKVDGYTVMASVGGP